MPRPLPPEQQEALEARGVVIPETEMEGLPADTVARVLGSVGLPHSEKVERIDDSDIPEVALTGNLESIGNPALIESYQSAYEAAHFFMLLVDEDEKMPAEESAELVSQLTKLKSYFEVFDFKELQPEVVLTPIHRDLNFWKDLTRAVQESSQNPIRNRPGQVSRVLRGAGFALDETFQNEWDGLTNPDGKPPTWQLSVTSGLAKPKITEVTSYGYIDDENKIPAVRLNMWLAQLNKPAVLIRHPSSSPLIQPDIHPTAEAYLMHQLTRIYNEDEPVDQRSFTWLKGVAQGGVVPVSIWDDKYGRIGFGWDVPENLYPNTGIRPSVRADHA